MTDSPRGFLEQLQSAQDVFTVELRPPMANLLGPDSMDAWIDTHHAVRRLVRKGRFPFLTDNAVGAAEEENLSHLGANLAEEVRPTSIIPFLTCKHSLDYCLRYAERAWAQGFRAHTNELPKFDDSISMGAGGDPNICYYHSYWELGPVDANQPNDLPPQLQIHSLGYHHPNSSPAILPWQLI